MRMEKSCRGYALSADTRSLLAKKCLLCTITARSILHGEYKWRNFVDADNSGVMYEGWEINCTHCRFPSFSSVHPGTFKTYQPALLRHSYAIRRTVNVVLLRPGDSNTWPTGRKRPTVNFFVTLTLILITQCSLAYGRFFYLQNEKYFGHKMSKMFTIRR